MKMRSDERWAWLALHMIQGLGNIAIKNLIERFGNPLSILEANLRNLMKVEGIREDIARRIANREFLSDPDDHLRKLESLEVRLIPCTDTSYPAVLKEIHHPPALLYAKGRDIPLNLSFVAVVGSRNATHYGLKAAETIGFGLASRGVGVVSGLARGIDSAAHTGCLRGKGFTVAVLGTGIDCVYPSENAGLFSRIIERGAILTEFPLGTPPEPKHFPIRNRIISGLSRGVVVVEATKKSGSLITASFALEQGRDVFAVPGSIDSFKSTGTHSLIRQGAKLIENADDILEEFGFPERYTQQELPLEGLSGALNEMSASQRKVYEMIGDYPVHIDHIVRSGDMDASEVLSTLMEMELKGIVKQLPGKRFVR